MRPEIDLLTVQSLNVLIVSSYHNIVLHEFMLKHLGMCKVNSVCRVSAVPFGGYCCGIPVPAHSSSVAAGHS